MKLGTDAEKPEEELSASAPSTDLNGDAAAKHTANIGRGPGKEGDLIIRDGFPALYVPINKKNASDDEKIKQQLSFQPMVNGKEPLPRHDFWSSEDVIQFDKNQDLLKILREDCETVFTARDKTDGAAYSAGQTFFIPANMKPRCALEALAMKIFQEHTKDLEPGTFNPTQSGANWWTLVLDDVIDDGNGAVTSPAATFSVTSGSAGTKTTGLDSEDNNEQDDEQGDDEVGLHFDADYELEEQTGNILLHPRIATVTYLSDHGAPTMVLEQKSPPMDDLKKKTLENGIKKAWLSHPKLGKHTAFDGRFLHGAPALYFPPKKKKNIRFDETKDPAFKRRKILHDTKRYTLLVNVWLNHWVMDAGLLDDEVCASLKTPWEDEGSSRKHDDEYKPPFTWNKEIDLTKEPANVKRVILAPSNVDPAGEDEIALCNHNVTVKYNPLMKECHAASFSGLTVEVELEKDAIRLYVGEELSDEEVEGE